MEPPSNPQFLRQQDQGRLGPRGGKFWGLGGGAGRQKGDRAWESLRVDRRR